MFARLISIPFFLLVAFFFYMTVEIDENYSYYIIPWIIILAVIYTMSPQINWWWYTKHPSKLDGQMRQLLIKHHSFYNKLSVKGKQKFRDRMGLYMLATEFIPKGWESIPEDIKGIIAANAVHLTFNQKEFLLPNFEKIVIYTIPFPSPQYPESLHASELFEEDGVFLFSAQQIMWVFSQPKRYYNLVLHEYIKAYQNSYPNKKYPILKEYDWQQLEAISGLTKDAIEGIINLPNINPLIVSGTLYFTHPEKYKIIAPDLFEKWESVFG